MFVNHQQNDWAQWLSLAEFAHNNHLHSAIGHSPFMVNYGQHPHMGHEARTSTKIVAVEKFVEGMKKIGKETVAALDRAAASMKRFYDWK
jgi:hypothetical protein